VQYWSLFLLLFAPMQASNFDDEFRQGLLALQKNDLAEAEKCLGNASRLNPSNALVWSALASTYLHEKDTAKAADAAATAAKLGADNPTVQRSLAMFYSQAGDFPKAAEWQRRYIETKTPDNEGPLFDLGNLLLHSGDFAGALAVFEKGKTQFPDSAQMELAYGVAAYGQRKFQESIASFLRVIKLDQSIEQPYVFLGRMLDQAGDRLPEITAAYSAWEKANADNYLPPLLFAKALNAAGGAPEAVEPELRKSIRLNADSWEAHLELGALLVQEKKWQDAAAELKRSIELNANEPRAHFQLARAYERLGEKEKSLAERAIHERLTASETNAAKP
jgi:tetratricopeptide (TPR) repeat protein